MSSALPRLSAKFGAKVLRFWNWETRMIGRTPDIALFTRSKWSFKAVRGEGSRASITHFMCFSRKFWRKLFLGQREDTIWNFVVIISTDAPSWTLYNDRVKSANAWATCKMDDSGVIREKLCWLEPLTDEISAVARMFQFVDYWALENVILSLCRKSLLGFDTNCCII